MRGQAYSVEQRSYLMGLREQGRSLAVLSREFRIPRQVLSGWWVRWKADGMKGLHPRSRRPQHSPTRIGKAVEAEILQWRRKGWGPARIALRVAASPMSVHRVLVRHGLNHLRTRQRKAVRRYEKTRPGELLHLDIKFLPALRNARYDYEFGAVDDFSREAVAWITTEQNSSAATLFLEQVLSQLPYRVEAVMTDNAWAFTMRNTAHPDRLSRFEQACRSLGIQHRLLRPHKPESNGKVERFFRTIDDECLTVQRLFTFGARSRALEKFLWYYNNERPHLSLKGLTPVQRRQAYFSQAQV